MASPTFDELKAQAREVYRDVVAPGTSEPNDPAKSAIRALEIAKIEKMEEVSGAAVDGRRVFSTVAARDAWTDRSIGAQAYVEATAQNYRWDGSSWVAFDDPTVVARDEAQAAAATAAGVVSALPEPLPDDEFALSSFETAVIGDNNRVADGVDRRVELDPAEYALARFTEARVDDRFRVISGTDRLGDVVIEPVVYQQSEGATTQVWSTDPKTGASVRLSTPGANETLISVQDGYAYWISDRAGAAPGGYCSPVAKADERPVTPLRAIAAYGDSMTAEGDGDSVVELLGGLLGVPGYNFGVSSNTSKAIAARQGGERSSYVPIGGVIPASGSVDLSPPTDDGPLENFIEGAASINGSLAGVAGTLSWDGSKVSFTRSTSGSPLGVGAPAPFIVADVTTGGGSPGVAVPKVAEMIQMFWMGRNDIDRGDYDLGLIVRRAKAMAEFLRPRIKRFIVMPVFNASSEGAGSAGYRRVLEINAHLRAAFPEQFAQINGVDARTYMVGLGASGDAADQAAYVADKLPPSLLRDGLHLNADGRAALADFLQDFTTLKGWL